MRLFIIPILLIFTTVSYGQQDFDKELEVADKHFQQEEYANALKLYTHLLAQKPRDLDLNYKYGTCLSMTSDNPESSIKHLLYAEKEGVSDEKIAFFIGRAYEMTEEYQSALNYYNRYIAVASVDKIKELSVTERIKSCKKVLKVSDN